MQVLPSLFIEGEISVQKDEELTNKVVPTEATDFVNSHMSEVLEKEISDGNLADYKLIETTYEEHFKGTHEQWYNVSCTYEADFGTKKDVVYSATVEKKFLYEYAEGNSEPTLTTTSWKILSEERNAKYDYPSMVEFSPQILKKDAENKTIEQISEELISLFMQHISTYNGESTFRLTEYENIKVNVAETKGKAWKENYWYSGDDLLPEGAVKCWQVTAWYKWNYVAMYPEYYALYTDRTLPK